MKKSKSIIRLSENNPLHNILPFIAVSQHGDFYI